MIYAFYSYKGGVGRTLTLAHSAIRIAALRREAGQRVLAIDLDLEAPGLDRYLPSTGPEGMVGFAGLLTEYEEAKADTQWLRDTLTEDMAREPAARRFIAPVAETENLFLMPAGVGPGQPLPLTEMTDFLRRLLRQAPTDETQAPEDAGFFRQFRQVLHEQFQYVLVDSRTGLSDPAYLSTILIADCIVGCVRLNDENIEGMRLIIGNRLAHQAPGTKLSLAIAAMQVPPRGGTDVEQWLKKAETLLPEIDENDPAVMHRTLFSKVSRISRDPSLELGECMVWKPTGEAAEGYTAGAPIIGDFEQLTERLLAESCDRDPAAAEVVEGKLYKDDKQRAVQYLFKRIEAEPTNDSHWNDIGSGYKDVSLNPVVLGWFEDVIRRWTQDPKAKEQLARAYLSRASFYGKGSPEGGLRDGELALETATGTPVEGEAASLMAQIIEELTQRKHPDAKTRDGKKPSYELANDYYTRAIESCGRQDQEVGAIWGLRARNYCRMDREDLAVTDFDRFIAAALGEENNTAVASGLAEQAKVLMHLGWYLAALKNFLAAEEHIDSETQIVDGIDLALANLGLFDQACQRLDTRRKVLRTDEKLYVREALVRILGGDIEGSINAGRLAREFSPTSHAPLILAVANFLKGDFEEADLLLSQVASKDRDGYQVGLHALAKIYRKQPDALEEIESLSGEAGDAAMVGVACVAAGRPDVREFSGAGPDSTDSLDVQIWESVIRILREEQLGEWRRDLAEQVDQHMDERPYLAVRCRFDADMCIVRKVWEDLAGDRMKNAQCIEWLAGFWHRLDTAKSPPAELLTPRDPGKPFEPDQPPGKPEDQS